MPATKQCSCQDYKIEFYLLFRFGQSKTQHNAVIKLIPIWNQEPKSTKKDLQFLKFFNSSNIKYMSFQGGVKVKNPPASQCMRHKRHGNELLGPDLVENSNPPALPGKLHRQTSLVGYSPMGLQRVRHNRAYTHIHSIPKKTKSTKCQFH